MATISIKVNPNNHEDIEQAISLLMLLNKAVAVESSVEEPAEKKAKKAKKPKAEEVSVSIVKEEPSNGEVKTMDDTAFPDEDTVRAALMGLAKAEGKQKAIDLLTPYGATKVEQLTPEQRREVYAAAVLPAKQAEEPIEFTAAPVTAPLDLTKGPGVEDVRMALKNYASKYDRAAAIALITKHGVKTIDELPVEHYATVIADCEAG